MSGDKIVKRRFSRTTDLSIAFLQEEKRAFPYKGVWERIKGEVDEWGASEFEVACALEAGWAVGTLRKYNDGARNFDLYQAIEGDAIDCVDLPIVPRRFETEVDAILKELRDAGDKISFDELSLRLSCDRESRRANGYEGSIPFDAFYYALNAAWVVGLIERGVVDGARWYRWIGKPR